MDRSNQTLYSFDVFDTLLARRVHPADAAYRFLRPSPHVDARSGPLSEGNDFSTLFSSMRLHAGRAAHERHSWATDLHDIYRELRFALDEDADLDGDTAAVERYARAEVEWEKHLLYPIPEGVQQLRSVRAEGHDVVFVSDMHMQEEYLASILKAFGLWQDGDRLFVSCDYGVTKGEGLFETLIQRGALSKKNVVHVGNSVGSDVRPARKAGLRAIHVDAGNPNRYETTLGNHAHATRGLSALLAGASRYARLHRPCTTPRSAHLRDVAAGVAAPVLTSFVLWALFRARRHGIERLYFTSHGGQLLCDIARGLMEKDIGVDCEVRHLRVCEDAFDHTRRRLMRDDRSPSEMPTALNEPVLAHVGSGTGSIAGARPMRDALPAGTAPTGHDPDADHDIVLDYLRQEGLGDEVSIGMVDVGWTGSTHALLNQVLMDAGMRDAPIWGGFFGLTASTSPYKDHRASYFFDSEQSLGYGPQALARQTHVLFEAFCASDQGAAEGYAYRGERVVPAVDDGGSQQREAWGLDVVRDTIHRFLDGLMYDDDFEPMIKCLRTPLTRVIRQFWDDPTATEADAWGAFPCKLDAGPDARTEPLATPFAARDLLAFATSGPEAYAKLKHPYTWPKGSLMTSPAWIRRSIRFVLRLGRGVKRVQRKLSAA